MEGGDKLSFGLCPLVVFCQSAGRRAGKIIENVLLGETFYIVLNNLEMGLGGSLV